MRCWNLDDIVGMKEVVLCLERLWLLLLLLLLLFRGSMVALSVRGCGGVIFFCVWRWLCGDWMRRLRGMSVVVVMRRH